ncbi:hypothetical protein [Medusavirus stheno T3]|uniref:Uncharacterized protein n=1 Tax=Medusavirus stheno T3 TaxID=3069717 RepID=A0A7S7YEH3_9VIRU|nr:hypothetical protein QKU73_gp116 [Acanthamoeba castellanii medusavirus]QPB44297.1 hypothetical protein [Medusavirus stheno T3]
MYAQKDINNLFLGVVGVGVLIGSAATLAAVIAVRYFVY